MDLERNFHLDNTFIIEDHQFIVERERIQSITKVLVCSNCFSLAFFFVFDVNTKFMITPWLLFCRFSSCRS